MIEPILSHLLGVSHVTWVIPILDYVYLSRPNSTLNVEVKCCRVWSSPGKSGCLVMGLGLSFSWVRTVKDWLKLRPDVSWFGLGAVQIYKGDTFWCITDLGFSLCIFICFLRCGCFTFCIKKVPNLDNPGLSWANSTSGFIMVLFGLPLAKLCHHAGTVGIGLLDLVECVLI